MPVNLRVISTAIKISESANFSTKFIKDAKLETINMSFASYETTQAQMNDSPAPLLIMHGVLGSKANWNSLSKAFHQTTVPQRKVVAVDARNHGDSPHSTTHTYEHLAEDVKFFLAQLKMTKAAMLGHSMGGRAIMYCALKYPELVDKLIVGDISPISTSINYKSINKVFTAMQKVAMPKNVPLSAARLSTDMQLARSINDKGLRAFILTNLVQKSDGSYAWRVNIPVLTANFSHLLSFPATREMKFMGPVLFVGGGKSDFIQKTDQPQILRMFPKAEFRVVEGAGHWLHSEKPKEFLQLCVEFLNRKNAAGT